MTLGFRLLPGSPGLVGYIRLHTCVNTLMHTPHLLSSLLNGNRCPVCSLENRGHSPAPICTRPSPGGSWEKAIQSRVMSRKLILTKRCSDLGTEGKVPAVMSPDGILALPEDIR